MPRLAIICDCGKQLPDEPLTQSKPSGRTMSDAYSGTASKIVFYQCPQCKKIFFRFVGYTREDEDPISIRITQLKNTSTEILHEYLGTLTVEQIKDLTPQTYRGDVLERNN